MDFKTINEITKTLLKILELLPSDMLQRLMWNDRVRRF